MLYLLYGFLKGSVHGCVYLIWVKEFEILDAIFFIDSFNRFRHDFFNLLSNPTENVSVFLMFAKVNNSVAPCKTTKWYVLDSFVTTIDICVDDILFEASV